MNDRSVRSTTKSAQSPSEGACRVTVALLHQDRAILPLLFAVLAIPAVLEAFLPKLSEGAYLALIALDRLLQDAHVIEMVGESYRTSPRAKANRSRANALPAPL